MKICSCSDVKALEQRIAQHEEIISQLVEIVAITNAKVSELSKRKVKHKPTFSLM